MTSPKFFTFQAKTVDDEEAFDKWKPCSSVYHEKLLERNRCYLNLWNNTVKNLWKLLLLWRPPCFLFFRIPKPKRTPSPATLSSLGWGSLRTSSAGTLRFLSGQTCSYSGLCQSCELLGPRLCSRSCGCLGWRYHSQQLHRLCYSGR